MFWGLFLYDKKGPCHIWEDETLAEKAYCKKEFERRNALKLEDDQAAWQLKQDKEYTDYFKEKGKKKPGIRPQFIHNEANGAYIRINGKGGID
jgi:hypothetical protein